MTSSDHDLKRPSVEEPLVDLHLTCQPDHLRSFYILLSSGVIVETVGGASVRGTLRRELGLSEEYIDRNVAYVILDGKPVYDTQAAQIERGSVLALSGVLPEPFLRHEVGWKKHDTSLPDPGKNHGAGHVIRYLLKIFNTLIRDLAPVVLGSGVLLRGPTIEGFFASRGDRFWGELDRVVMNGERVQPAELKAVKWPDEPGLVRLTVNSTAKASARR